jgi:hypothetical protein
MNNVGRWALGLLSITPVLAFLGLLFLTPRLAELNPQVGVPADVWLGHILKITWLAAFVLSIGHLVSKNKTSQFDKVMWALALLMASMLVFPIYWATYVRPKHNAVT